MLNFSNARIERFVVGEENHTRLIFDVQGYEELDRDLSDITKREAFTDAEMDAAIEGDTSIRSQMIRVLRRDLGGAIQRVKELHSQFARIENMLHVARADSSFRSVAESSSGMKDKQYTAADADAPPMGG